MNQHTMWRQNANLSANTRVVKRSSRLYRWEPLSLLAAVALQATFTISAPAQPPPAPLPVESDEITPQEAPSTITDPIPDNLTTPAPPEKINEEWLQTGQIGSDDGSYPADQVSPVITTPQRNSPPRSDGEGGARARKVNPPAEDSGSEADRSGKLGASVNLWLAPKELKAYGVTESGAVVTGVFPGKAAEVAGIQPGDVIVEIDGQPIKSGNDVRTALQNRSAGDQVRVVTSRRGQHLRFSLRLSPAAENQNVETFKAAQAGLPWAQVYIGHAYRLGQGTKQDFTKARYWYQKAADAGVGEARVHLAGMHERGEGGPADLAQALALYEQVANQGDAKSQYKVASMYQHGNGASVDNEKAANWFKQAAEQGYAEAQRDLAGMSAGGEGTPKNDQAAFALYTKAAEAGDVHAMAKIGHIYAAGVGVPVDYEAAARWLTPAAEAGDSLAQNDLGALHYYGNGVERNFGKAAKWLESAGNQGNTNSQAILGAMYTATDPPDYEKARHWLLKASEGGAGHAIHTLGVLYGNGLGVAKDKKTAMQYYVQAVNAGYWESRYSIAILIVEGDAFKRNDAEALKWLKPVAERTPSEFNANERLVIANAQWLMGTIYQRGANNVPKNNEKAMYWYEKAARGEQLDSQRLYGQMLRDRQQYQEALPWLKDAAERGDRAAQNDLGVMYLKGQGVPKSEQDAIAWLLRAYQQGSPAAKDTLRNLGVDAK